MELEIVSKIYGKHIVYIDNADFKIISRYKWHLKKGRMTFYAATFNKGNSKDIRKIKMHQLLTGKKGVDHKDGNGLNNKRNNLREATPRQNSMNKRLQYSSSTGFKGVTLIKRKGLYKARIRVNGVLINGIGSKNIYKVALSYNEMAIKYFGQFAKINVLTKEQINLSKKEIPLKLNSSNTTGYRGVCISGNKFVATLFYKKNIYLGSFDTPEKAAKSYNDAVIKYHKPKSFLNKIPNE